MPFEVTLDCLPAGICVEASRGGGMVKVQTIEFVSEEDGDKLIDRLEGFGSNILEKLPGDLAMRPSQIQHMLAIIRRDRTATVYVNELSTRGMVQVKRDRKAGDPVFVDDIVDFQRLVFEGISIPNNAGVLFIFSLGWRRAIFYDFSPLGGTNPPLREYDVEAQLGQFYSYLMFQKRFKITDPQWKNIMDAQWFPFITLKEATIRNLISHAAQAWPLDELSEAIAQEVKAVLPELAARWKKSPPFADHVQFLEKATQHYLQNDYISTTAILYPRIEGLLRSHQRLYEPTAPATQKGLSGSATKKAEVERHESSPLLPAKFREYLESVYFAAFDPNAPCIKVSRNSVGHGVASADQCSLKSATISLLIVDQLCFCFSGSTGAGTSVRSASNTATNTPMTSPSTPPDRRHEKVLLCGHNNCLLPV